MAHNVLKLDRGMTGRKIAPWHIRETADRWSILADNATPDAAGLIAFARQDGENGIWNPRLVRCYADAGDGCYIPIPGSFHVVRDDMPLDDPQRFISAGRGVGKGYTLTTNRDMLDYCNALTDGGAFVESAGSLFNGQRVWVSLMLRNGADIIDEQAGAHLLLTTAHDGTAAFEALVGCVLTVCWNTLSWNRSNAKTRVKIRHTVNVAQRLAEASDIIEVAAANFTDLTTIYRNFAMKQLSDDAALKYFETVIRGDSKQAQNTREKINELYHGGQIGASLNSRRGTLFGAVNAVSQYVETEMTTRKHKDENGVIRSDEEVRAASVLFGAGSTLRDKALDTALAVLDY